MSCITRLFYLNGWCNTSKQRKEKKKTKLYTSLLFYAFQKIILLLLHVSDWNILIKVALHINNVYNVRSWFPPPHDIKDLYIYILYKSLMISRFFFIASVITSQLKRWWCNTSKQKKSKTKTRHFMFLYSAKIIWEAHRTFQLLSKTSFNWNIAESWIKQW